MNQTFKFNFGDVVTDKVTGFKGTVVAAYVSSNCKSYHVQPRVDTLGKMQDCEWVEESNLELSE